MNDSSQTKSSRLLQKSIMFPIPRESLMVGHIPINFFGSPHNHGYTLLFIPGINYSHVLFYPWAAELANRGFQGVVMDYNTQRNLRYKTITTCAVDILLVIEHLVSCGVKNLILAPHSMACLAVRKLVNLGKVEVEWWKERGLENFLILMLNSSLISDFTMPISVQLSMLRYWIAMHRGTAYSIAEKLIMKFMLNGCHLSEQYKNSVLPFFGMDSGVILREIANGEVKRIHSMIPVMSIASEFDLINPSNKLQAMAVAESARFIVLDGANHMSICEPPKGAIFEEFYEAVTAFTNRQWQSLK